MSEDKPVDRFPLTDVIDQLRSELSEAVTKAQGEDLQFKVNEIELELKTVIEEGRSGDGGFNFSVLKFGGGFNDKNVSTQTIKLKLEPIKNSDTDDGSESSVNITGKARRIS